MRLKFPLVRTHSWLLYAGLTGVVLILFVLGVGIGAVSIPARTVLAIVFDAIGLDLGTPFSEQDRLILLNIRLPRVILAGIVGAGLALAGTAMQGLFRNPLAEPGLIGVSSGAMLGAVAFVVLGERWLNGVLPHFFQPIAAFLSGLFFTSIVFVLGSVGGKAAMTTMLLVGIAMNALIGSAVGLLLFLATDHQIRAINFWMLGSLSNATWTAIGAVLPFLAIGWIGLPFESKKLNALLLGEAEAFHLGVNVENLKRRVIIYIALTVGASVAFAGLIGFVGLIAPHLIRLLTGPDHRKVMPAAALTGAGLLIAADMLARTIVSPAELPIGILTGLLGAPFFLWLLYKQRPKF